MSIQEIRSFDKKQAFPFFIFPCYDELMELQVGVKVLLKNKEGKYLLLRRSAKKYPETGEQWDMVGGRINPGTTLMENLDREVREEAGLTVDGAPKLVAAQDILRVPGRHVVRLTYVGRVNGEPKLSDEHDGYRWFELSEIGAAPKCDPYLKELLDGNMIQN